MTRLQKEAKRKAVRNIYLKHRSKNAVIRKKKKTEQQKWFSEFLEL